MQNNYMQSIKSKNKLVDLFVGEPENALMTALYNAAEAQYPMENGKLYKFLEETPKTSLVAEIVQELTRLGYAIKKT